ncbi:hypothetical protein IP76_19025 [Rhizobium sp. AAP43]|nr:hypothetical protein IP76_19025 [Rhizobium sp. AAP43]
MSQHLNRAPPLAIAALALGVALVSPAMAQTEAVPQAGGSEAAGFEKPAPYDDRLTRLSEVVGAVHYLRNLCNSAAEPEWRQSLSDLMENETKAEPKRRARLTAAYNRGYRSFASVYTTCTAAAVRAEENYRNEGATLAAEITARYGN